MGADGSYEGLDEPHSYVTFGALDAKAVLTGCADCFYQEKGAWYYAGVYQCFRFPDLSVREWSELSDEVRFYKDIFLSIDVD